MTEPQSNLLPRHIGSWEGPVVGVCVLGIANLCFILTSSSLGYTLPGIFFRVLSLLVGLGFLISAAVSHDTETKGLVIVTKEKVEDIVRDFFLKINKIAETSRSIILWHDKRTSAYIFFTLLIFSQFATLLTTRKFLFFAMWGFVAHATCGETLTNALAPHLRKLHETVGAIFDKVPIHKSKKAS
eukprot:GHVP01009795.1.p1 GENE.GHVP01009795.1~~GHVP01009795.1.p1  ORF type:complete len:185 (-),score=21.69 GHVP01009795.1:65-619(-)